MADTPEDGLGRVPISTPTPKLPLPEYASSVTVEDTVQELTRKMHELELQILGKPTTDLPNPPPFRPVETIEQKAEHFQATLPSSSPFRPVETSDRTAEHFKAISGGLADQTLGFSARLPPVTAPLFDGQDLEQFSKEFLRFLRLTGLLEAAALTKKDWFLHCCAPKLKRIVESVAETNDSFESFLNGIQKLFPKVENTVSLRQQLQKVCKLANDPSPAEVEQMLLEFDSLVAKFPNGSLSEEEKLLLLVTKVHPVSWKEIRSERNWRARCDRYSDLKELLREKARDDMVEKFLYSQISAKRDTNKAFVLEPNPNTNSTSSTAPEQNQNRSAGKGGKGKGKGKGSNNHSSNFSKPWTKPAGITPATFKAKVQCKFCNKVGHYESECWTKEKQERRQKAEQRKRHTDRDQPQATHSGTDKLPNRQQDKKRKFGELNFLRTFCLDSRIQGHSLDTILDTGATVSAVAKRYTRNAVIDPHDTMYIRVGNGEVIHSMGSTEVEVDLGSVKCMQKCQVIDTSAFDCVLGTDFLHSGPVNGLLLKPARLIVNNKEFPLRESGNQPQVHRLSGMFSTDDYKLRSDLRQIAISEMHLQPSDFALDLFASPQNTQEPFFCCKGNSAWKYNWKSLAHNNSKILWCNPPFTRIARCLTKVALDKCRMVIVTPDWGAHGPQGQWRRLLDRLTLKRVCLPDVPLYEKFGDPNRLLPKPAWSSMVSLIDGSLNEVSLAELDPAVVTLLSRKKRLLTWDDFQIKYFPHTLPAQVEVSVQAVCPSNPLSLPGTCANQGQNKRIPSVRSLPMESRETDQVCESVPVSPCLSAIPHPSSDATEVEETFDFGEHSLLAFTADLVMEVERGEHEPTHEQTSVDPNPTQQINPLQACIFSLYGSTTASPENSKLAYAGSKQPINQAELKLLAKSLEQKVPSVGEAKFASENLPSEQESDIISGEFEKDMARFEKSSPDLLAILAKHQLVFGPLPPP